MILHILNKSPLESAGWQGCLSALGHGHGILLIEDAVYGMGELTRHFSAEQIEALEVSVFALESDVRARGLATAAPVNLVNYQAFVDLTARYAKSVSWF